MQPRFETLSPKKLLGLRLRMSLAQNKTGELWRSFMPRRKEIKNNIDANFYSLQLLPVDYFSNFNPAREFEKWALVEVKDYNAVPAGMEPFMLPGGLYAVFHHKGDASTGPQVFQYIMGTWLPASGYELDDRPHFEILGEKYKNNDPESEEEIWIPVKKK